MSTDHNPYSVPYAGYPAQGYPQQAGYAAPRQGQPAGLPPTGPAVPGVHPPYGYQPLQSHAYSAQPGSSLFDFGNDRFLKGLLIGAAATYILTNETVQRTAIKAAVKGWSLLQGGVEELKERFQDAEAEIRAAEADKGE